MTRRSRLRCASKCVGTEGCRAYVFNGEECRFLKVAIAGAGDAATACDSLTGTTYLMQPVSDKQTNTHRLRLSIAVFITSLSPFSFLVSVSDLSPS